jgi:hypothetical protein
MRSLLSFKIFRVFKGLRDYILFGKIVKKISAVNDYVCSGYNPAEEL